ncbi:class I SAM-dependent methyltransferase [Aeromicrobium alkaliterrae]|uniref:Class I SAM-dependent methyltransferase n=1 Tax=Aeromicrobium alkaliterrae TaxID=302168 RepID=A0ABN2JG14_9ACTN
MSEHQHDHDDAPDYFEQAGWDERYSGPDTIWSGNPNPQLVTEVTGLTPGTALDLGSGEGGDVIWLAQQGWTVTGADFSPEGLARAARHAEEAGVGERTSWWRVDARTFAEDHEQAGSPTFDLVTTHFLHPGTSMVEVVAELTKAVAPGGHLLVVGHAPSEVFTHHSPKQQAAMWHAEDMLAALGEDFETLVVEQRPRRVERDGRVVEIDDATLLARRIA